MAQKNVGLARRSSLGVSLLCFCLVLHIEVSTSATFHVGDSGGWILGVESWPKGKSFKAGDKLVFVYNTSHHNVVVVDAAGYSDCTARQDAKEYDSGHDTITLTKGDNYFICSVPDHCDGGMKIAVKAT